MGETRYQRVDIPTDPMAYPRYIGEVIRHPFIQNTELTVLEVWDRNEVWGNENRLTPFDYGQENNPVTNAWYTPPPRRDDSSKYPIYKCLVNGTTEQWIVFKWILLDGNIPTDLLGYSTARVGG